MRKALVLAFLLLPAVALAADPPPPKAPPSIDTLFDQLKKAQSPEEAKPLEDKIGGIFLISGSPSIELLMTRAAAAMTAGDNATAKKLLESITDLAPKFGEGWRRRALLQRAMGDDNGAMQSLGRAILANPRNFNAMYELGQLFEEYGNKAGALKIYRRALELDPQLDGAQKHIDALTRDVEGEGI
ncbi:MAG: tetratricopeptide repeat protein [Proteobacteria bacterium]|nr:tetratricopeptide repeat protein [Pseudomonadota bacterium]